MHIAPTEHSAICRQLFSRPTSSEAARIYDGYLSAMDTPRYAQLVNDFDVTTIERVVPLLATWAHETGGFRIMWESGVYTSAERIVQIFGAPHHSAAVTPTEARKLVRNPYALFERVYGLGNPHMAKVLGNTQPGDGFNFRGLGPPQITGRRDHEACAAEIGCAVSELADPINGFHAALIEWREKKCNALAVAGDLRGVRRAINGGYNGWEDFNAKCALIRKHIEATEYGDEDAPLSLGSRGPAVAELQQQLRARGFYENAKLDDIFGALMHRALVAFQAAHGLQPTGVYDVATQAAMAEVPPEATLPGRKAPDFLSMLAGARGRIVRRIDALWKWILGLLGITGTMDALQVLDKLIGAAEKSKATLAKLAVQPRFILYAIGVVIAVFLIRCVRVADAETAEAQKTGQTL